MSYQDIDREIAHLEVVFVLISTRDRFPLSYWYDRLRALYRSSLMPAQRVRVERLEATLRSLHAAEEQLHAAEEKRHAAPLLRATATQS